MISYTLKRKLNAEKYNLLINTFIQIQHIIQISRIILILSSFWIKNTTFLYPRPQMQETFRRTSQLTKNLNILNHTLFNL